MHRECFTTFWARGVERKKIFLSDEERLDFLGRLERASEKYGSRIFAWCLMSNHFHLAIRTGEQPLSKTMRSLLTGYAMYFNRRNKRYGHLFQNRYKSTVVDEEQYFLALVRYIHLNPVRARIVGSIDELTAYPWSGHAALMGQSQCPFQEVDVVLRRFGKTVGSARKELMAFMKMDEAKSEKKTFEGGGLIRSAGGAKELAAKSKGEKWAYDSRVLGSSSFVESVLREEEQDRRYQRLSPEEKQNAFDRVLKKLCARFDVVEAELLGGSKVRRVSEVRQLLSYAGCRQLGFTAAEVARNLNVSSQSVLAATAKTAEHWDELDWLLEDERAGK